MRAFRVGSSVIGQDYVRGSTLEPAALVTNAPDAPVVNISGSTRRLYIEPGRDVYLLDSEGPTSAELREIIGGINGQRITLAIACPERLVNVRDVAAVIAKEPNLELEHPIIVPGGDFMLREGDAVTLELDSAIGSWVELERTWASWTYDDLAQEVEAGSGPSPFVTGPASAADLRVAVFDGTTGRAIKTTEGTVGATLGTSNEALFFRNALNFVQSTGANALLVRSIGGVITIGDALAVDNLKLDGNTVSSTDTDGDINLTPDGNGVVKIGGGGQREIHIPMMDVGTVYNTP